MGYIATQIDVKQCIVCKSWPIFGPEQNRSRFGLELVAWKCIFKNRTKTKKPYISLIHKAFCLFARFPLPPPTHLSPALLGWKKGLEPMIIYLYISMCCSWCFVVGSLICWSNFTSQYFPLLQSKDTLYVSHLKIRFNKFDIRFLGTIRG